MEVIMALKRLLTISIILSAFPADKSQQLAKFGFHKWLGLFILSREP